MKNGLIKTRFCGAASRAAPLAVELMLTSSPRAHTSSRCLSDKCFDRPPRSRRETTYGPRTRAEGNASVAFDRQTSFEALSQALTARLVERRDVARRRPGPAQERRPVVVE